MRVFLIIVFLMFIVAFYSDAQKRQIDNTIGDHWPTLKNISGNFAGLISPTGDYYSYIVGTKISDTVVVASTDGTYVLKRIASDTYTDNKVQFSASGGNVGILFNHDSLEIINLLTRSSLVRLAGVERYLLSGQGKFETLIVKKSNCDTILLISLSSMREMKFSGFVDFTVTDDMKNIYIRGIDKVALVTISDWTRKIVYTDKGIDAMDTDGNTNDLYILTRRDTTFKVVMYDFNRNKYVEMISSSTFSLPKQFGIVSTDFIALPSSLGFVFRVEKLFNGKQNDNDEDVSVWAYDDQFINERAAVGRSWTYLYNRKLDSVIRLFNEQNSPIEDIRITRKFGQIITQRNVNTDELVWNNDVQEIQIYSLYTGMSKSVCQLPKHISPTWIECSPGGRFVVWWDYTDGKYCSYEVATGSTREITSSALGRFQDNDNEIPIRRTPFGIACWLPEDSSILIYDEFDIWKIDPMNSVKPRNITNAQGRRSRAKLRIVPLSRIFISEDDLLISYFNIDTKMNGLLTFNLAKNFKFNPLSIGPFCYRDNNSYNSGGNYVVNSLPQRAHRKGTYLVRRESATESPNLFMTSDFVTYRRLTNITPEVDFRWYQTKLVEWRNEDGEIGKGVLYLPEVIDSSTKYPLIINYYEKRSDELYVYKAPRLSYGDVSIPWYTSHDYLVFVPDIPNKTGNLKSSLAKSIKCALDQLGNDKFIDTSHVGIQGHSHGGYETYLLATSLQFKAAQASSGFCDLVGFFSHIFLNGTRQNFVQYNQTNLGSTPWGNRGAYVENSPIYYVDLIHTPMLIMHCHGDQVVPFWQSAAIYAALRRLQRPAWLLSYPNEGHTLDYPKHQLDFTIKQQQFFAFYLKGEARPGWLR